MPNLFLTKAASNCTEQIKPRRKSDTGTALRTFSVFKIQHPVQTLDYIPIINTIKTNTPINYLAYLHMVEAQVATKSTISGRQNAQLLKLSRWG